MFIQRLTFACMHAKKEEKTKWRIAVVGAKMNNSHEYLNQARRVKMTA